MWNTPPGTHLLKPYLQKIAAQVLRSMNRRPMGTSTFFFFPFTTFTCSVWSIRFSTFCQSCGVESRGDGEAHGGEVGCWYYWLECSVHHTAHEENSHVGEVLHPSPHRPPFCLPPAFKVAE